jgi:RNA polymerase sigma-70 factor (ECF subfamily)
LDEAAQAFLGQVRPHWPRLYHAAQRYCARTGDASDLVQETLLRAWRSFTPISGRSYERARLFTIMRNVVIDWHRARRRRLRFVPMENADLTELAGGELTDPLAGLPTVNEEQFREFLDARVAAAVDVLDDAHREVLILSVVGDLTYGEIAEVLDCPIGTVMSRMARARRSLRERLADYARAEGWLVEKRL